MIERSTIVLTPSELGLLSQSTGFCMLSEYLSQHPQSICNAHRKTVPRIADIIVRDVIHTLLAPIVELFNHAVFVAEQATRAVRTEDYEYAFRGLARTAFLWLQCFLDQERKWCLTQGCPSCVVNRALDSEFHIRLLSAASLLSDMELPDSHTPSLPSMRFFLRPLEAAIENDRLWGEGELEQLWPKIEILKQGLEEMIEQIAALDAVLNAEYDAQSEEDQKPLKVSSFLPAIRDVPLTKLKRSKLAKRQAFLERESRAITACLLDLPTEVQPQNRSALTAVAVC